MLEDSESGQVEDIDVIPNEEMLLVIWLCPANFVTHCSLLQCYTHGFTFQFQAISEKGYVKRMKPDTFNLQKRGTIGKSVGKLRDNDTLSDFLVCHAHDHVLYFRYSSASHTFSGIFLVKMISVLHLLKWLSPMS